VDNLVETTRPLVLIVDNSRAVTGALNAIRHATNPLREQVRFAYVVPTGSSAQAVLEQDGYAVSQLPFIEISRRKADLLLYVPMLLLNGWRLFRLAKRQRASIIHLNDFYNLTGYIAQFLSFGRLKLIVHVRFLPQSLPQPLARSWKWLAEARASQVVCVSKAVQHYFQSRAKTQVIYDPLPGVERYPAPVQATRSGGTVHLLYLSNYIRGKGQNYALQAFQLAYAHQPQLRLTFVGGDMGMAKNQEFRQELEAEVASAGLTSVVSFAGFAADTEQLIKSYDIVLNFSEAESFSLTCLDALYFGTPLIASDCGGPAELFEHGQSGFLVPNRDVAAMATAIGTLASSVELRTRLAQASRQFVRQKFAPAHTYQALAALYQQALASK